MSPATGRQIEIADLNEAKRPLADWLLAKRQPRGFVLPIRSAPRPRDLPRRRDSLRQRLVRARPMSLRAPSRSWTPRRPYESWWFDSRRADRMRQTAHADPYAAACDRTGEPSRSRLANVYLARRGALTTWTISSPSSMVSTTSTDPRRPVSKGCPPDVG